MANPERFASSVRIRVTFPETAYARLEKLADALAMPVPDLVRFMSSMMLVQWERAYLNPHMLMKDMGMLESDIEKDAMSLFPEVTKK